MVFTVVSWYFSPCGTTLWIVKYQSSWFNLPEVENNSDSAILFWELQVLQRIIYVSYNILLPAFWNNNCRLLRHQCQPVLLQVTISHRQVAILKCSKKESFKLRRDNSVLIQRLFALRFNSRAVIEQLVSCATQTPCHTLIQDISSICIWGLLSSWQSVIDKRTGKIQKSISREPHWYLSLYLATTQQHLDTKTIARKSYMCCLRFFLSPCNTSAFVRCFTIYLGFWIQ